MGGTLVLSKARRHSDWCSGHREERYPPGNAANGHLHRHDQSQAEQITPKDGRGKVYLDV